MRVDIYRRPESAGIFSYLAVPEGRPIPDEAVNTDWEEEGSGVEAGEQAQMLIDYGIQVPVAQMEEKGYAITSLRALQP